MSPPPEAGQKERRRVSWFRLSSLVFAFWAVVFVFFPRFTNEFAGIAYGGRTHAEDWTQLVGLLSLGFAVLLNEAHRAKSADVRRIAAISVLSATLPCAFLMTYWQIIPDRQWSRLDIMNILFLYLMSYGMFLHSGLWRPKSRGSASR
jgi:drug/metabolite transporter (DMT)-like permease